MPKYHIVIKDKTSVKYNSSGHFSVTAKSVNAARRQAIESIENGSICGHMPKKPYSVEVTKTEEK